jgi:uncharacterized membrane protein YfcA
MGVAGGEVLIPTIVLLFGAEITLAGSLGLLVSLPTMVVVFARYSRDQHIGRSCGRARTIPDGLLAGSTRGI